MPNGSVITQFGLRQKNGVKLINGVTAESVRVQELANKPSIWTFIISTGDKDSFNSGFHDLMQEPTPAITVRLGQDINGSVQWEPWQDHVVTKLRAVPKLEAYTILMQTSDRFAEADRATKTASWQGEISSIVEMMAIKMGLVPVVEKTVGRYSLIQSFQSDYEFIHRLLGMSVNSGGRADYITFVRDGQLHFHTPGFILGPLKRPLRINGFGPPVHGVTLIDDTQTQIHIGSAGAKVYAFNPASGQMGLVRSKPTNFKMAKNTPELIKIAGSEFSFGLTLGQNTTEPENRAQAIYGRALLGSYAVNVSIDGALVHINEFVELDVTQSSGGLNPWSGRYVVTSAKHSIKQGSITSSLTMVRGEIN